MPTECTWGADLRDWKAILCTRGAVVYLGTSLCARERFCVPGEQFCVFSAQEAGEQQFCATGKQLFVPGEQLCNRRDVLRAWEHFCAWGAILCAQEIILYAREQQ